MWSVLKNRLSAYLKKVWVGQTILVLDRDKPIARIEPVDDGSLPDDRLAALERAGILKRASRPISIEMLRAPGPVSGESVVDALLEERRQGR